MQHLPIFVHNRLVTIDRISKPHQRSICTDHRLLQKKHREIKKTKHPKEDPWSWHIFLHLNHVDGIVIGEYTSHIDPVGPIQVLQNGLVDTSA